MSKAVVSIMDYSREIGRASFEFAFGAADTGAVLDQLSTDLQDVLNPLILGNIISVGVSYPAFEGQEEPPIDPFAQRELGLRILMEGDSSGRNYSATVPTPDLDALTLLGNSDDVDLADAGVMAALVAWIEANVEYPFGASPGTESVTVKRAYIVGRNN